MRDLYLEDFHIGDRFESASIEITERHIFDFARAYDPQPFHLDRGAAEASPFGELVGSGWHTAALTMRLIVESPFRPAGGIIGFGVDELRWPNPIRPGDRVRAKVEVLDVRPSASKPDRGTIRVKIETVNQDGAVVISFMPMLRVPRRGTPG